MRLYDGIDIIYRGIYHSLSTWLYFIEYFIHNNTFVFRRRLRRRQQRQQWQRLPYLNGNTKILLPTIGYIIIIRGFYIAFFRYPSSHSHPFHHSLSLSPHGFSFLCLLWFFFLLFYFLRFFSFISLWIHRFGSVTVWHCVFDIDGKSVAIHWVIRIMEIRFIFRVIWAWGGRGWKKSWWSTMKATATTMMIMTKPHTAEKKYIFGINTQHSQQRHTLCAKVYYYNLRVKLSILFMEIYSIEFAATHTHTHSRAQQRQSEKFQSRNKINKFISFGLKLYYSDHLSPFIWLSHPLSLSSNHTIKCGGGGCCKVVSAVAVAAVVVNFFLLLLVLFGRINHGA